MIVRVDVHVQYLLSLKLKSARAAHYFRRNDDDGINSQETQFTSFNFSIRARKLPARAISNASRPRLVAFLYIFSSVWNVSDSWAQNLLNANSLREIAERIIRYENFYYSTAAVRRNWKSCKINLQENQVLYLDTFCTLLYYFNQNVLKWFLEDSWGYSIFSSTY